MGGPAGVDDNCSYIRFGIQDRINTERQPDDIFYSMQVSIGVF
jgi:hypothetical protein